MASRPIGTGDISFGLVSIPVKLFPATNARATSFILLHSKDLSRIQQKIYCPVDNAIIDRGELVRGFEVEKGRYVAFTDGELKKLEARNEHTIEITEFLPLRRVDPVYFEKSYYLGSEANAAKAYRLLADAMSQSSRVALGRFTMRGKEHLVLIRPFGKGLMLHTIYYSDEMRPAEDVDQAENEPVREAELILAKQLIGDLTGKKFDPSKYHDHYRERILEVAQQKVAGQQVSQAPPQQRRRQVIDLMSALKASLEKHGVTLPEQAEAASKTEAIRPPRAPRASSERRRAGSRK